MNDRSDRMEELRFAKKQQWTVATATVTLLAALYAVANHASDLQQFEKLALTILAIFIAVPGICVLFSLQSHLGNVRIQVDEKTPLHGCGAAISASLVLVIGIAALIVIYSFRRDYFVRKSRAWPLFPNPLPES